ncbi:MAG: hypothetical protein IKK73_07935 [Akkermansia sp.]|nr:hypothetical protein [Akkermansia sp.]MBR6577044.1 hypothetical protein [Akkermansia sp.]
MKDTFTQAIRLGIAILILAFVLGWADAIIFAPRRMPACVQEKLPRGRICPETLAARYGERVVWIDARSQGDFELNHLMLAENRMFPIRKGAEMQQQIDAAIGRMLEAAERGECIVVFCTSECTASEEIAAELRELGIIEAPIYTLQGGWDSLKASGMAAD